MFLSINAGACMGHGRCYAAAAGLLSDDEEGFVAQRGQAFEVPDGMLDEARDAADACPEGAISLRAAVDADA
ncbi:ferredoxin [Actinomadura madurae]|uniref:ferredoxin n=1 Tax=Actinomadura madurae TaxID=1993 RepID=UPI002026FFA5|nr:ferredoxin [Actinomadura madurae]MCP9964978.1 ferredoxin [Actinomadura madurae]URN04594.1 ferredoxin [Actinomadura madurae]